MKLWKRVTAALLSAGLLCMSGVPGTVRDIVSEIELPVYAETLT